MLVPYCPQGQTIGYILIRNETSYRQDIQNCIQNFWCYQLCSFYLDVTIHVRAGAPRSAR